MHKYGTWNKTDLIKITSFIKTICRYGEYLMKDTENNFRSVMRLALQQNIPGKEASIPKWQQPSGRFLSNRKLTSSMGQNNSWEADSHSTSQENFSPFTEPEGSLQCSQQLATGPYPKPDESNPHFSFSFPKIHSNILLSAPRPSGWTFTFRFTDQNFTYIFKLTHACYIPAHLMHLNLIA